MRTFPYTSSFNFFSIAILGLLVIFTSPKIFAAPDSCTTCGKTVIGAWHADYNTSLTPFLAIDNTTQNALQMEVDFHQNSNAVGSFFAGKFLSKGVIDNSMKLRVLNYVGDQLKYEDELKTGFAYRHYFPKSNFNLWGSYYHRNWRYLYAPRDAFELVFYGNKPFEDKTADLSNIRFENCMYNQYSLGISKNFSPFFAGVNVSFLQGFDNQQFTSNAGSLYTAPLGEYLDATYNFQLNKATSGASRFFEANGLGFSADLHWSYRSQNGQWSFDIQDLGFISWNKSPVNFAHDTSLRFEGYVLDNITAIEKNISIDAALRPLLPRESVRAYSTVLPTTLQLVYSRPVAMKKGRIMVLHIGINTRNLYRYYAYVFLKTNFLLKNNWSISAQGGYGGYSSFTLGMEVAKRSRHIDFCLGTTNLIGSILPMYYPGSSLYLRVVGKF